MLPVQDMVKQAPTMRTISNPGKKQHQRSCYLPINLTSGCALPRPLSVGSPSNPRRCPGLYSWPAQASSAPCRNPVGKRGLPSLLFTHHTCHPTRWTKSQRPVYQMGLGSAFLSLVTVARLRHFLELRFPPLGTRTLICEE